ncbi:hypothetical protein M404DRAFT_963992 [Pisolithus tinctorius Marx 270]|uniref:Uncharacterized protein n=1 Tax=Pisolithus tinctorius Marx 270 TaxID=870435 RepID=A0A0C3NFU9_PISTI|nr:hypothetical protein M404DRAFT_963992 [Pisolithus tinctorius Marx 270]
MPMLAFNPHEAVCPNFTSEKYLQARECLLNDGINHEAAANQLELLWTVNNDLERQEWDRQTLAEQEADEERETSHRRVRTPMARARMRTRNSPPRGEEEVPQQICASPTRHSHAHGHHHSPSTYCFTQMAILSQLR